MQQLNLPAYTLQSLKDHSYPQSKALEWLSKAVFTDPAFSEMPQWRKQQLFALATVYYAFLGDSWPGSEKQHYLSSSVSECDWRGDDTLQAWDFTNQCDLDGRFTRLTLDYTDMAVIGATMPPEITLLSSLEGLLFGYNVGISGEMADMLPTQLVDLSNLTRLTIWLPGVDDAIDLVELALE